MGKSGEIEELTVTRKEGIIGLTVHVSPLGDRSLNTREIIASMVNARGDLKDNCPLDLLRIIHGEKNSTDQREGGK